MRERLLVAFGTLILVIVALYGIPRAYLLADGVEQVQSDQLNHSADFLAELIPERASTQGVDQEYLAGLLEESERIEHLDAEGELIVEAGEQLPEHGSDIVATRELPQGQELILTRSGLHVQDSIADALTPVVVIGVGLTLSAGIVCLVMARKLSRPFQDLAAAARQLGSGRFDLEERDYKLPEAQAIGSALTNSLSSCWSMSANSPPTPRTSCAPRSPRCAWSSKTSPTGRRRLQRCRRSSPTRWASWTGSALP